MINKDKKLLSNDFDAILMKVKVDFKKEHYTLPDCVF